MSMKQIVPILGSLLLLSSPMLVAQAPAAASHPPVEVIKATTPDASAAESAQGLLFFQNR